MNDDLSLTQALGGLRIANPDDVTSSPTSSNAEIPSIADSVSSIPPQSSHSSSSTSTATITRSQLPTTAQSGSTLADVLPVPNTSNQVTPAGLPYVQESNTYFPQPQMDYNQRLSHRQSMPIAHQAQQQLPYAPHSNHGMAAPRNYATGPARPMSGIYNHPNVSGGSQASNYSTYRYGDEPPQPVAPPQRTSSRAGAGYRGTADYSLSTQNNLPPPRRSSRRISPGTSLPATPGASIPLAGAYAENGPPASSEEWKEKGAAVGVRREVDANGQVVTKVTKKGVNDFEFGRTLGEGSYSTVLAATDRATLREYAVKVLDKKHIIKEKKVKYVNIEKDTLNRLTNHPGIVKLYFTFQDERSLYFVLDLASNGELLGVLKKMGTFDEECTRFYGSQILDAVEYMHSRGVLHRDLKPENVLLDSKMHVKITDFGTGKILDEPKPRKMDNGADPFPREESARAVSFVGTAEYVSPELLTAKEGGKPTDLWAFGCIIFQLLTGRPPFKGATEYLTFDKILKLDYTFPSGFPDVARDLVERLLVPDPSKRLTIDHVKNHPFFDGVNWGTKLWEQKAPRLKPYVPPPPAPIRLNNVAPTSVPSAMMLNPTSTPRPLASRLITELPAPSQLDIEWSPVLTRSNERILKLGNLIVTVSPQPHSPNSKNGDSSQPEQPRKFSRFFMSGPTTKKRQRLVMVTSSGRIVLAASGGDEKKAKMEIPLVGQSITWKSFQDSKGLTQWCVDTREKHILFEVPLTPPPEPDGTRIAAEEWLDCLFRARELYLTQQSLTGSYSNDSAMDMSSSISSPAGSSYGGDNNFFGSDSTLEGVNIPSSASRLRKEEDANNLQKGRKRFSRRQSKNIPGSFPSVF
ncbi:Pkinase-domain-containing protein [Microthyrium microscopicum]|uniref:non-specific serine/threonine protein kinase n=1 Tax=Microthyrium microscopicum TaxID=703497 RepID=A0A6A6URY0_9PEZI|nr:Pkinase-domain-containing protein [Microthyrium microscopicum]